MKRVLTASVIAMGVLILAGLAALVIGIMNRAGSPTPSGDPALADPDQAVVLRLGLPAQTRVLGIQPAGQALAIHLSVPDRGDWVYIVPTSGRGRMVKIAISAPK